MSPGARTRRSAPWCRAASTAPGEQSCVGTARDEYRATRRPPRLTWWAMTRPARRPRPPRHRARQPGVAATWQPSRPCACSEASRTAAPQQPRANPPARATTWERAMTTAFPKSRKSFRPFRRGDVGGENLLCAKGDSNPTDASRDRHSSRDPAVTTQACVGTESRFVPAAPAPRRLAWQPGGSKIRLASGLKTEFKFTRSGLVLEFVRQHGVSRSSAARMRRLSGTAPMSKVATLQQPLTQRHVAMTRAEARSWQPSAQAACSHKLVAIILSGIRTSTRSTSTGGRPRLG
jgi:hypothetical protein